MTHLNNYTNELEVLRTEVAELRLQVKSLLRKIESLSPKVPLPKPTTHISAGAKIAPGVALWSKDDGHIHIGQNTSIFRNAEVNGPVRIGEGCLINRDAYIRANTTIGNRVFIGPFSRLITDSHEIAGPGKRAGKPTFAPIVIGDGCWIGAGSTILGGVTIGPGSIIAAGSVVTHDLPANSFAAGVPARVKKTLDNK